MKRAMAFALLAALVIASPATAGGFLRVDGTRIVDENGQPVLLRGMGLGGWMLQEGYMLELPQFGTQQVIRQRIEEMIGLEKTAAFYQAWLDNHTTKADIDAMASWGFNSIRLPMHYGLYTLPVDQEPVAGEQTWLEEGFRRTDELLAWAKANDMYLILDLHAAPGGQGNDINISDRNPDAPSLWDSPAHQDKMIALWRKLAERYRDEPNIAAYDIINEPNWGFENPEDRHGCEETENVPLRALLMRSTAAIREVDKKHIIVVEGNCWGNNYKGVFGASGAWDDNMVLSFHKYWNVTTRDSIADILKLRDELGVPVWLGETGENSNDWFARAVALVESEGVGWAMWPLKKIRYNNPLQIVANDGYLKLLAYWRGDGEKPTREEAEQALMRFAGHDVRYENNVFHKDVVDALFRAPHSERPALFRDHVIAPKGGEIAAADFDMGRDGVAYHDLTPANHHVSDGGERVVWNPAMTYRNDGVDLGETANGEIYVAGMQAGEWVKYTITAEKAGAYALTLNAKGKGRVSLMLNGGDAGEGRVDTRFRKLVLLEGRNTLIVKVVRGGFDLMSLSFSPADR
ncbi:MAG: cellulase family glycosylhydrolase [Pseudomonadota bacterium]|nr:cellulase family glycosylhydrolase [Pseudomonadota bacterium]